MSSTRSPRSSTLDRVGPDPPYDYHDYVGTRLRAPKEPLVVIPATLSELTGPGVRRVGDRRRSTTTSRASTRASRSASGSSSRGRVLGSDGKPLRGQLVEIWQANAAGRYPHAVDTHDAPLDPNFTGGGRCLTDDDGWYRFVTVKPGAYPWGNHRQRVATEPHPLLAVRTVVHGTARDADVLPRRPALRVRPDLQLDR